MCVALVLQESHTFSATGGRGGEEVARIFTLTSVPFHLSCLLSSIPFVAVFLLFRVPAATRETPEVTLVFQLWLSTFVFPICSQYNIVCVKKTMIILNRDQGFNSCYFSNRRLLFATDEVKWCTFKSKQATQVSCITSIPTCLHIWSIKVFFS